MNRIVNSSFNSLVGDIIKENPSKDELDSLEPYTGRSWNSIKNLSDNEKREYLLEFLRYFYYKEGRIPEVRDFTNNLYLNFKIYQREFGSWNNAIRKAYLIPNRFLNNEELLKFLIPFYEENGRPPIAKDFYKNPKYPNLPLYQTLFGTWQNALKIIGLDIDSIVRRGIIETKDQKGRLGEIFVLDHFEEIGKIGHNNNYTNNVENLKQYEITEKIKPIFEKWRNSLREWTKEEILADARSKFKIYVDLNNHQLRNQHHVIIC